MRVLVKKNRKWSSLVFGKHAHNSQPSFARYLYKQNLFVPLIILRFLFPSRTFQMCTTILLYEIIFLLSSVVTLQLQLSFLPIQVDMVLSWKYNISFVMLKDWLPYHFCVISLLRSFLQQTWVAERDTTPGWFCTFVWEKVQAACCSRGISLNLWFGYYTIHWLSKSSAVWEELENSVSKYIKGFF